MVKSLTVDEPAVILKVSVPPAPVNESVPSPLVIISLPPAPIIISFPAFPVIVNASNWFVKSTLEPEECVSIVSIFLSKS